MTHPVGELGDLLAIGQSGLVAGVIGTPRGTGGRAGDGRRKRVRGDGLGGDLRSWGPKVSRVRSAAIRPISAYRLNSRAGPTQPNHTIQQGGDEGREAGHHGRDLIGQRSAGSTARSGEQFGEPPALGAGQSVLADGVGDHQGHDHDDEEPGVHEHEHQHAPDDAECAARQVLRAAADPVRQPPPSPRWPRCRSPPRPQRHQGLGPRRQLVVVEVGDHVGDRHRVAGRLGDAKSDAPQDVAPVVAHRVDDGRTRDRPGLLDFFEDRRLRHLRPDDQSDPRTRTMLARKGIRQADHRDDAEQEDQVGQQQPDREAGLDDAGEAAFAATVRARRPSRWPRPIRRRRPPLDDANGHQQDGGEDADGLIGR